MKTNGPAPGSDAVEQTIGRALTGLREAQPRSGLNGRILASLEQRAEAAEPVRLALSARFAVWSATSAAAIALASLLMVHHRAPVPVQSAQKGVIVNEVSRHEVESKKPNAAAGATTTGRVSTVGLREFSRIEPGQASTEPARRVAHPSAAARTRMPAGCPGVACRTHDDDASVALVEPTGSPTEAQALADLHAPSHPAPPLPLTPQEKLFLRMLRYGNATQLAELDPIVRAKENADETAAFKAFFPDPPPIPQSNGDNE